MPLTVEHSVQIAAPPAAIWKMLIDPNSWRFWWPNLRAVEVEDRKLLHEGSTLELALQLGFFPVTYRPRIEIVQEPKTLHWTALRLGVTSRHAFYLEPRRNGTAVLRREMLSGPGLVLFRLLRLDHSTAIMFRDSLRGLKRLTERSV